MRCILIVLVSIIAWATEPGFVPIVDGVSLKGWTMTSGNGSPYFIENGSLVCPEDGGRTLYSE